jgi:hypothetical protein
VLRLRLHQPCAAALGRTAGRFGAAIVFAPRRADIGSVDEAKDIKPLTPEAQRALAEAEERRKQATALPAEQGGPSGPEPTRYGDWERKGIAVDF